jgi:hypothetical protein
LAELQHPHDGLLAPQHARQSLEPGLLTIECIRDAQHASAIRTPEYGHASQPAALLEFDIAEFLFAFWTDRPLVISRGLKLNLLTHNSPLAQVTSPVIVGRLQTAN